MEVFIELIKYFFVLIFLLRLRQLLGERIKNPIGSMQEFLRSRNDLLLFVVTLAIVSILVFAFWPREDLLRKDTLVQLLIFLATLSTLFYSTILRDDARNYRERGIIDLSFDQMESDLFHLTNMDVIKNGSIISTIPTYYVRLRVNNIGKQPLNNVQVVIEKVRTNGSLARPFLSLNLHWAFNLFGDPRVIKIPRGVSRIIDFLEINEPRKSSNVSIQLNRQGDPDGKRYDELGKGFRSCTLPTNALSDIYPFGNYEFLLSISADHVEPLFANFAVEYNGRWDLNISRMRNYLKVELKGVGRKKEEVFT